jgi:hypothetical protein
MKAPSLRAAVALLVLSAAGPWAWAAADTDSMLRQAIESRATVASGVGSEKISAVFLDNSNDCAFAALVHARGPIENFSFCQGAMSKRNVSPPPWPDTPAAREFRGRVIYLALLYGTSSGIDPNGYKIRATLTGASSETCKIAEVSTSVDHALVRLDLLPACPH